ncbi:PriCT-2 domain-containing protein [Alcanivorax sp. IL3]|uniref:PriCT-2 domain-containing protein n=1 Tax=unclassified Alcanivorax TaxID=2638842 RepID=UPI0039C3EB00
MPDPLPLQEAGQALLYVDPNCDRDTWFSIAGALKSEYGDTGWDLFESWSQQGHNYDKGACKTTWRSAKPGHYSIGTLIKLAKDGGWERPHRQLTAEEKRQLQDEQQARRKARQAAIEADEARLLVMHEAVAGACQTIWDDHTQAMGKSAYLGKKGVGAHGVRFFRNAVLLVIDDQAQTCEIKLKNEIRDWFGALPSPRPEHISFLMLKSGAIAVPMRDCAGYVWAIQTVNEQGTKLFPKYARKKGLFHVLGELDGAELVGFAEGYATAATAYELGAGWPVVTCFDSGNMYAVAAEMQGAGLLEGKTPVWLADNDPPNKQTGKRAGQEAANKCQQAFGGVILTPNFPKKEAA